MNEDRQEWYVAERTRALALMHLTRRDDLTIERAGEGSGLDYLVYHTRGPKSPSHRPLGVLVRGTRDAGPEQVRKEMGALVRAFQGDHEVPFPVCLLYFVMQGDQGHYAWVAEPAVTDAGPRLLLHTDADGRPLDHAALDEIVAAVDGWYDAFFGQIAFEAS